MRLGVALLVGVVLLVCVTSVTGVLASPESATDANSSEIAATTIEGISLPLQPQTEQTILTEFREKYLIEDESLNAYYLFTNSTQYIVIGRGFPGSGQATVSGTVVSETSPDVKLLVAESASVTTTPNRRVSIEELAKHPERYRGELVEVTGNLNEFVYALDTNQVNEPVSIARLSPAYEPPLRGPDAPLHPPGRVTRWGVQHLADASRNSDYNGRLVTAVSRLGGVQPFAATWQREAFATNSTATVTVAVTSPPQNLDSNVTQLAIIEKHVSAETVSLQSLADSPAQYTGRVVRVEGYATGTRLSTKEALLSVSKCGPDIMFVAVSPEPCIPAPTDMVVHSGVLTTADGDALVPYVGLSNVAQDTIIKSERGRYSMTARVVATEEVAPRLDAPYILVVQQRERVSASDSLPDMTEADSLRKNLSSLIREQVTSNESAWGRLSSADDRDEGADESPESFKPVFPTVDKAPRDCGEYPSTPDGMNFQIESDQGTTDDKVGVVVIANNTAEQTQTACVRLRHDGEILNQTTVTLPSGTGWFFWLNATYDGKEDTKVTFQANGGASTSVLYIDPITLYPIYHRPEGVVSPGDQITLRMKVSNIHDQPLEQEFRLHENGEVIATKHVEIPADGERVIRFDYTLPSDATDDLNVSINGTPAALIVSTPTATTTSSGAGPGLGVVGTVVAIGVGLFVVWRLRYTSPRE
jgi:hypothetical protein